jgi:uncharacterized membrane protein
MGGSQEVVGEPRAWPWWRLALVGLSAAGLALSVYLAWHHLAGGPVAGCGGTGGSCDQLLGGRWSTVGGVLPVSGLAAGVYLAMLVASFFVGPATPVADRRLAWGALLLLAGAAVGSGAWFVGVQTWVVGAFCPYCMAAHLTGALLAGVALWAAGRQAGPAVAGGQGRLIGRGMAAGLPLAGVMLAGVLAASQVLIRPLAVYQTGVARAVAGEPATAPRAAPRLGPADAPYVVTLLFDFKCPHCQRVHALLDAAVRRYNGKLAFALCPTPLNTQCNPHVQRDVEMFRDACELAKVGLAVWAADPAAYPAFDQWMFSFEAGDRWRPRTLEAATAKAVELVGQAKLDAARADPWVDEYLRASVKIYGDTFDGAGVIPKLIYGSTWVCPEPEGVDDLLSVLHDTLGVPAP